MPTLAPTVRTEAINPRWYGAYRVPPGTVKITGTPDTPVRRRVRLHDQATGRLVAEKWSGAATGAYTFDFLRQGVYIVYALPIPTDVHGGEIETDITLEPMP